MHPLQRLARVNEWIQRTRKDLPTAGSFLPPTKMGLSVYAFWEKRHVPSGKSLQVYKRVGGHGVFKASLGWPKLWRVGQKFLPRHHRGITKHQNRRAISESPGVFGGVGCTVHLANGQGLGVGIILVLCLILKLEFRNIQVLMSFLKSLNMLIYHKHMIEQITSSTSAMATRESGVSVVLIVGIWLGNTREQTKIPSPWARNCLKRSYSSVLEGGWKTSDNDRFMSLGGR